MPEIETFHTSEIVSSLIEKVRKNQDKIHTWLSSREESLELPLYSSVDIRDSGFKIAVVDTNLFPAGFNNLCPHGIEDSTKFLRETIKARVPHCQKVLIVAEEHTRNTWYLENIRVLEEIIEKAGFETRIATFLSVQPYFCENAKYVELETATGNAVKIYCFKSIIEEYKTGQTPFDLIILNNDLSTGIPEALKQSKIPIYPSLQAGWHSRLKSHHFSITQDLVKEFAKILDVDPWFFSCLFTPMDHIDINFEADRLKLEKEAEKLFDAIAQKYKDHNINEKPYLVVKSDSGTYGMGLTMIESPSEILDLNRKEKNKLHVGKGSQVITRYILQEGVPTIYKSDEDVSEVCLYQIENNMVGGFYRSHPSKSSRENLNSQGATFNKLCPHLSKYGIYSARLDINVFDLYRILGRIAGIAAHREVLQLEANIE